MMNRASGRRGAAAVYAQAKDFSKQVAEGRLSLREHERRVLGAFRYFVETRAGGCCDAIPIEFGRLIFPVGARSVRFTSEEVDRGPFPFAAGRMSKVRRPEDTRETGSFEEVDEQTITFFLSLNVMEVANRYSKAG